jgi:hypothetical protein
MGTMTDNLSNEEKICFSKAWNTAVGHGSLSCCPGIFAVEVIFAMSKLVLAVP